MRRLVILVGITLALAMALPDTTQATSFHEIKKLTASDAQASDTGPAVAVSSDTAVGGEYFHDVGDAVQAGATYISSATRAARTTGAR